MRLAATRPCARAVTIAALLNAAVVSTVGLAGTLTITDPGQGPVDLPPGTTGATELSGLTYKSGNQYYTVTDNGGDVYPLAVNLNLAAGTITGAALSEAIFAATGDTEGIAYYAGGGESLYIASEDQTIRRFDLSGSAVGNSIATPAVFANARGNLGFESLGLQVGHQAMWTANEQALTVDGPEASSTAGTRVRLLKYEWNATSETWNPAAQYVYLTEPVDDVATSSGDGANGVSDLLVLPNGKLLILERDADVKVAGTVPVGVRFHSRIFEVDLGGATDVSAEAGLDTLTEGVDYTAVSKDLLWDAVFGYTMGVGSPYMFEGMTLGPELDNGGHALLLVSDDQGNALVNPGLYALSLGGQVPEPGTGVLLVCGLLWAVPLLWRRRHHA